MSDRALESDRSVQCKDDGAEEESALQLLALESAGRREQGAAIVQHLRARGADVQRRGEGAAGNVHAAAARGVSGSGGSLPHLQAIQRSFGRHDVGGVQAHVGGAAREASETMGAQAYATGNSVAFKEAPDMHTAAHEAAHVVQQRGGVQLKDGVGQVGDRYEQHADAVADLVVQGKSAEGLLDRYAGGGGEAVQMDQNKMAGGSHDADHPEEQGRESEQGADAGDADEQRRQGGDGSSEGVQARAIQRRAATGQAVQRAATDAAVQQQALEIAALGLAVFESGRSMVMSGSLGSTTNTPSYMHQRTPAHVEWASVTTTLKVHAWHPRITNSNPEFVFRLSYEYNGYDIRNARVLLLRDASSSMTTSSFSIEWGGQAHSRPNDPVAQVVFNIAGQWNPWGRGDFSFWGQLIISAARNGQNYESYTIDSERAGNGNPWVSRYSYS